MISRKLQEKMRSIEPRFSPVAYRGLLVGMLIAAFAIPLMLAAIPYIEFFNDMAVQRKAKAENLYGYGFGKPQQVDRLPVPGTIPMDYVPYTIEGKDEAAAKKAEATLTNPLVPTMPVLLRGQKIFHDYCRTCHGVEAEGDGPIIGPNLFPAPPSLHTDAARNFKDGRIFHIITRGQNNMPSYADKISVNDRWAVIHYVRVLQRAHNPKPEDLKQ